MISLFLNYIRDYGIKLDSSNSVFTIVMDWIISIVTGYNHKKYWKRRKYVVDNNKGNLLVKLFYLQYIKRIDSKRLSSFGTSLNQGAYFSTPPNLPHGPNGIIVGYDAQVGSNVTILQQVTIPQGKVVIGDNVLLGAGCKILPGVKIGNNVKVGANAVVISDIPDNSTAVGIPARIVNKQKKLDKQL